MLYLMHCSFDEEGEARGHGYFTFLVDAKDPEAAKRRLRKRLDLVRARDDMFDGDVEIYLKDVVEFSRPPKRGAIGRYQMYYGKRPHSLSCSLPLPSSPIDSVVEPEEDEDEDEPDEGVILEPFVVYRSKVR